jgi:hypothetical protein
MVRYFISDIVDTFTLKGYFLKVFLRGVVNSSFFSIKSMLALFLSIFSTTLGVASIISDLDWTPQGLFPNREEAAIDPKCLVISKVMQALAKHYDMSHAMQAELLDQADKRYTYLSSPIKLTLTGADNAAFHLYQKGVPAQLAKEYYSFKLSEADAQRWSIVIIE